VKKDPHHQQTVPFLSRLAFFAGGPSVTTVQLLAGTSALRGRDSD